MCTVLTNAWGWFIVWELSVLQSAKYYVVLAALVAKLLVVSSLYIIMINNTAKSILERSGVKILHHRLLKFEFGLYSRL